MSDKIGSAFLVLTRSCARQLTFWVKGQFKFTLNLTFRGRFLFRGWSIRRDKGIKASGQITDDSKFLGFETTATCDGRDDV